MNRNSTIREEPAESDVRKGPQSPAPSGTGSDVPSGKEDLSSPKDTYVDENQQLSQGKYRDIDNPYRNVDEMNRDFTVRRMVNRLAKYMRGDYVVNSRMEKYMNPRDVPDKTPEEKSDDPGFSGMDDQHMILPERKGK